jgi:hypothetical protein
MVQVLLLLLRLLCSCSSRTRNGLSPSSSFPVVSVSLAQGDLSCGVHRQGNETILELKDSSIQIERCGFCGELSAETRNCRDAVIHHRCFMEIHELKILCEDLSAGSILR